VHGKPSCGYFRKILPHQSPGSIWQISYNGKNQIDPLNSGHVWRTWQSNQKDENCLFSTIYKRALFPKEFPHDLFPLKKGLRAVEFRAKPKASP